MRKLRDPPTPASEGKGSLVLSLQASRSEFQGYFTIKVLCLLKKKKKKTMDCSFEFLSKSLLDHLQPLRERCSRQNQPPPLLISALPLVSRSGDGGPRLFSVGKGALRANTVRADACWVRGPSG